VVSNSCRATSRPAFDAADAGRRPPDSAERPAADHLVKPSESIAKNLRVWLVVMHSEARSRKYGTSDPASTTREKNVTGALVG